MDLTSLTATLADLNTKTIVCFAVALTIVRLTMIRMPGQTARAIVEVVEAALIAGVLVFMVIQPFFVKAFYIPSGSMLPTLIEDDHILVNRFLYRMHGPDHGDVVVFNAPPQALDQGPEEDDSNGPVDYIKRLIGLPGDTIQVVGGTVTIGNLTYDHDDVRSFFNLTLDADSKDEQHLKFVNDGVLVYDGTKWTKYPASEVARRINGSPSAPITISPGYVIRNGVRLNEPYIAEDPEYNLKISPTGQMIYDDLTQHTTSLGGQVVDGDEATQLDKEPPGKVPPGEVIVMGDNRNDSNDSSRWGPLTEDRLVGRAVFIFYPFTRIHPIR
jgi:signal peptidase I